MAIGRYTGLPLPRFRQETPAADWLVQASIGTRFTHGFAFTDTNRRYSCLNRWSANYENGEQHRYSLRFPHSEYFKTQVAFNPRVDVKSRLVVPGA